MALDQMPSNSVLSGVILSTFSKDLEQVRICENLPKKILNLKKMLLIIMQ